MQQTEKYKFNLIGTSDAFSPDALNDNARKLEDALITHEAVVDSKLKSQRMELEAVDDDLKANHAALEKTVANNKAALEKTVADNKSALEKTAADNKAALEKTAADNKTALEQALAAQKTALEKADATNKTALEAADTAIRANLGSVGTNCRFVTGSFKGKGGYGSNNKNTLTFSFKPQIVFLSALTRYQDPLILLRPFGETEYGSNYRVYVTWTENSVSWYSTSEYTQLNQSSDTTYYLALGF